MVYKDIDIPLPAFIAIDWTLMTLAVIFIILRLTLRKRQSHRPTFSTNLSDFFIILSWLSGIVLISINTWKNNLRYKYVNHEPKSDLYYMVPRDQSSHLLYVSWISLFFIYISLWAAKAAFLAFYHSLFHLQGRKFTIVLVCASVFTFLTFLLHMLLLTLWCAPISSNWNIDGKLCSAVHSIDSVTISTFTNIATDVIILLIPVSTLAGMSLTKTDYSSLLFVFLMGGISIVAALARFVTLKLVQHVPKANITHTIDVWALVEIVASILAVCLPSLRVFVRGRRAVVMVGSRGGESVRSGSEGSESLEKGCPVKGFVEKSRVRIGVEEGIRGGDGRDQGYLRTLPEFNRDGEW
ncbi:hypothetical protein M501DRAFT_1016759 [Patellaria atrata CBS 101060]|uniref:Rhodopsin domain-containing protein n=1 Tax=Patellaria atrata CBS 101060 TaxID=1346257 RepID=A0A9P4SBN0_9PEZI|nr:hypothetical protein M501DRAFT_1016759 [Patellaria atrata CBS 101060]